MYLVAVRCNDLKSYLHAPSLSPERVCSTLPFTTVAPRHAIATGRHADVPAYTRDLYAALTAAMHSTAQLGPESCSSAPTSSSLIVHAPAFYQYQRLRGVDPLGRDERGMCADLHCCTPRPRCAIADTDYDSSLQPRGERVSDGERRAYCCCSHVQARVMHRELMNLTARRPAVCSLFAVIAGADRLPQRSGQSRGLPPRLLSLSKTLGSSGPFNSPGEADSCGGCRSTMRSRQSSSRKCSSSKRNRRRPSRSTSTRREGASLPVWRFMIP